MSISRAQASRRMSKARHSQKQSIWRRMLVTLYKYIIPFLILNSIIFYIVVSRPEFTVKFGETTDYLTTDFEITLTSHLPVKNVKVTLNSNEVELKEGEKYQYSGTVNHNGTLEIYIENINGMSTTVFEQVNSLDDTPPSIADHELEQKNDILTIWLDDSQSGVDYTSIYAITDAGIKLEPDSIDQIDSSVTFKMNCNTLTIYAKDLAGNESQASFADSDAGLQTELEESN